jgi:hypothetical protein
MTTVLRYPYEAITETTDYLQIAIKKYVAGGLPTPTSPSSRRRIGKAADVGATASSVAELVDDGIILLPMPSNIQDSNSVGYGDDSINSYAAMAAGLVTKTITDGNIMDPKKLVDQIGANAGLTLNTLIEDDDARLAVNRYFASQAVNVFGANVSPDQILARSVGRIFNPNMELLFNNVTLRSFRFSFKMTPRDENESLQIKSIIRSFKRNMAPKVYQNAAFLETPNIFELTYRKGNTDHPFLNKFKECALTDIGVNYTGENVYATYADGTPISIIMDLTFKELVPIYDSDYNDEATDKPISGTDLKYKRSGGTEGVGY